VVQFPPPNVPGACVLQLLCYSIRTKPCLTQRKERVGGQASADGMGYAGSWPVHVAVPAIGQHQSSIVLFRGKQKTCCQGV